MLDAMWVVLCAALVFNMQLGFLCLESGLTRSKNAINVAVKNMADLAVAVSAYWLFGFSLMFGASQAGWWGEGLLGVSFDATWTAAFFLFQAMFCTTAATIVSGAAAERMRFSGYLLVALVCAGLIYPFYGHWAWAGAFGAGQGWLEARGFVDFAGSTVVHSVGGWVALAVVLVLGPRQGRFDAGWRDRALPASNLPMAMLGALLLMFGWFGFNGGSTFAFNDQVPPILANTVLAAVAGTAAGMLASWWRWRLVEPVYPLNGLIAGLVAVTAGAHAFSAGSALLVGFLGGLVMWACDRLLLAWHVDDAVGGVPAHLASGIWGTLAVALLGNLEQLGTGLDRGAQLVVQFQGVLVAGLWAFGVSWLLLRVLDLWRPLRVSPEDEHRGLNVSEHGARNELVDLLEVMATHQRDGWFSREVPVEPFTEVGQIAAQYNKVVQALRGAMGKTRAILRDIRDGVVTCTPAGELASCNPGAERLFGQPAEALVGRSLDCLVADAQWRGLPVPEAGSELQQELVLRGAQQREFVAEVRVSRGELDGDLLTCLIRDITERKRIEEQLSREKMLAQVTLESIGDGVITTGADGLVRYLNPVAEQLTGWRAQEALGEPLSRVYQLFDEVSGTMLDDPVQALLRRWRPDPRRRPGRALLLRKADGGEVAVQDAVAPIRDAEGCAMGAVLTFRDVSETRQLANKLSHQAAHDALTGLFNRTEFERLLAVLIGQARTEQREHVLCYMDLDQFKIVNDTCGHAAGDELLRQLARLLEGRVRDSDALARLGGDEFGLILVGCPLNEALQVAEDLRALVADFRFSWEGKSFAVGVSIGLVALGPHSESLSALLSAADSACYAAKDAGRNRIHLYQDDDEELIERRGEMRWAGRIRQALDEDLFRLYVQPIMAVGRREQRRSFEVLLRMLGDVGEVVPPGAFMPAAERYDLAPAVDRWVVGNFLAWMGDLHRQQPALTGNYSINLSAASIGDDSFLQFVLDAIERHEVPTERLCFEITETTAIANLSRALTFMQRLKAIGCVFALDDFGSGLSSFAYLKTLPVDYLKIDGVFVKDVATDPIARAMVTAINAIGHEMGLKTVAEFVENQSILEQLEALGVDYAQGYHLGQPVPLTALQEVRMMPR